MDTETYNVGDVIYGMTGSKKTALIQIQKVKGNKALGTITKGHVAVGGKTMVRGAAPTRTAKANADDNEAYAGKSTITRRKKISIGVLGTYASQTAKMTVQSTTQSADASLTGSAMGFKGFADFDYSPNVTLHGAFGLQPLATKGSIALPLCDNGTNSNCKFNYNFIAIEGAVRYNLVTAPSRYWIGAGYTFLVDGGHSNNTPNVNLAGGTSQMIALGAGADFALSKGFIPVSVEYGIFPSGGGVTITSILVSVGYGWSL